VAHAILQLGCCLNFHQSQATRADAFEDLFDEVYEPLLDLLEASSTLRLSLSFSGNVLEHALARRPAFLDRLGILQRDGRIELLGGAFYGPVLSAIPERDALGQIQYTTAFHRQHLQSNPSGVWLALQAWDPALPSVLTAAGVDYTLLDAGHFLAAGCGVHDLEGYYTTERSGQAVSLVPLHREIGVKIARGDKDLPNFFEGLAARGRGEASLFAFSMEGHALMRGAGLESLTELVATHSHWLKTELPGEFVGRQASRGRVYLSGCVDPSLSRWLRPAEAGRRYLALSEALEGIGMLEDARPLLGPVLWDNALVKYPEANRLHKRMLRVSHRVDKLRSVVLASARKSSETEGVERARSLLGKACTALWQAQNHCFYWHGPQAIPGLYDARARGHALRLLLSVERTVDRLLKDPSLQQWTLSRGDFDADGVEELLVRTPHFSALIHPRLAGGLVELDLRQSMLSVQSEFSPVDEPEPIHLAGHEIALVFEDADERAAWEGGAAAADQLPRSGLSMRRRGAFVDRFLGPETTLSSFARRQFRELGSFSTEPYEMLPVVRPEGEGESGTVTLSRSAAVKDVEEVALLRVEKSYRFGVVHPRLLLDVDIFNRSRDAARGWYGLEWSFGVPSGALAGVRVEGALGDEEASLVELNEKGVDLGLLSWLQWADNDSDLRIRIRFSEPLTVWWVPVDGSYSTEDGAESCLQGNTFLFHRPLEIWGEETSRLSLQIDFVTGT
jgi:4-alpha-glucanotransferase